MPIVTLAELQTLVGQPLGASPWLEVTQSMINLFAEATGDDQFIHVDPERAERTPLGGTVAQGFLSLSLMPRLLDAADLPCPQGVKMRLNYGGNRTRFLKPVRSGTRVRGRFALVALEEKRPGQFQMTTEYVLEIEGSGKPALIAEWITQIFL